MKSGLTEGKMGVVCQNDVFHCGGGKRKAEREKFKRRSTDGTESSVI